MTYDDNGRSGLSSAACFDGAAAPLPLRDVAPAHRRNDGTPLLRHGRYAADAALCRSNLTTGAASTRDVAGLPLYVLVHVYSISTHAPRPVAGVQIEVQHCNAFGRCSDGRPGFTRAAQWLRGHQSTDVDGMVAFRTIYPGWQSGSAVHLDLVARYYDRAGHASFEYATSLYFDDAVSDRVHSALPYSARGARTVRNADDALFVSSGGRVLALRPTGDHSPGYIGEIALGLALRPGDLHCAAD